MPRHRRAPRHGRRPHRAAHPRASRSVVHLPAALGGIAGGGVGNGYRRPSRRSVKIGIVSQSYYPRYGGVTEHVHHTAVELRRRGHEVVIITSHFRRGEANHSEGVVRIGHNLLIPFNGAFVDLAVGLRLGRQLRDLITGAGFDLLHTHAPLVPTLPLMAIRAASCAQVGTFHTTAGRSRMLEWARPYLAPTVEKLDARIAVSTTARDFAASYFPGQYVVRRAPGPSQGRRPADRRDARDRGAHARTGAAPDRRRFLSAAEARGLGRPHGARARSLPRARAERGSAALVRDGRHLRLAGLGQRELRHRPGRGDGRRTRGRGVGHSRLSLRDRARRERGRGPCRRRRRAGRSGRRAGARPRSAQEARVQGPRVGAALLVAARHRLDRGGLSARGRPTAQRRACRLTRGRR
ncbi:MAG: hypothetical protein E6K80_07975 [Candidatus Eisenbacteria bacterium]|uniref:Glycosyltransferase subfamily 4-like N-terminal domain-containing protein n=1 Tax=Eiseniibacteriota bacterium TaxID=2212470 RepID=A0A538U406_UNCEI|nr:MAG: hypothetical protein E6K80_07975 [Candidatus Eisenbacteria bacterium]